MRCTQTMGLTQEAQLFLDTFCKRTPKVNCPTCGHITGGGVIAEVYASAADEGMFEDGPELHEYTLNDDPASGSPGGKIREIVQAVPWSSGPCIFLCLKDAQGNRIHPWSDEEINNA